jgi:hypothetical protein
MVRDEFDEAREPAGIEGFASIWEDSQIEFESASR